MSTTTSRDASAQEFGETAAVSDLQAALVAPLVQALALIVKTCAGKHQTKAESDARRIARGALREFEAMMDARVAVAIENAEEAENDARR